MKVFVIPDIHLKPWILEQADEEVCKGDYDKIVFLGDFVDDWGESQNIDLYNETFDVIRDFLIRHDNCLICFGNHDISYVWGAMESGYSPWARETVLARLKEIRKLIGVKNQAFIHRIDKVLFSHAGLSKRFVKQHFANDPEEMYPEGYLQVVGHTPVCKPELKGSVLTLDTFSTRQNGNPIGNEKFVWIDTETKEFRVVGSDSPNDYMIKKESWGNPKYRVGDPVKVKVKNRETDDYEIKTGEVYIVDAYGTIGQKEEASYDVMVGEGEDRCLYKHIRESEIINE